MNKYSFGDAIGLYSSSGYSHDDLNGIKNNASNFYNGIDDNTSVADIQGYISTLNTVLPTVSLNVPAAGKHYRFRHPDADGNYMLSDKYSETRLAMGSGELISAIFYYGEDGSLRSFASGLYLPAAVKNGNWTCVETPAVATFGAGSAAGTCGFYIGDDPTRAYYSGRKTYVDAGGNIAANAGYDWVIEEVTELPVAHINNVGYTTLEAAKAAALATTEAVEIVLLAGSDETIVFPANVTINKNGFTADNLAVAVAKIGDTLYATLDAAKAAALATTEAVEIVLLAGSDATIVFPANVTINKNGFTAENLAVAVAKIGDVLYATLAEAANVATKGQTVTILRSTDETAVFAYGVVIEKAEGVVAPNATNEVAVDVPADVVGDIVNNSGVETETVNGVVGALQNNEAVISNTPTNLPVGAKLVVTLVNIIFESEAPAKVVYDVTPKNGDAEVEPTEEITFRLPVPANWKYAKVYHAGTALEGIYPVQEGNYVEVASQDFSEFAVEIAEPVAKIGDVDYYTFEAALAAATEGQTITLVADVTCTEKPVFNNGGVVNVDINGHKFVSSEKARVRCVASADGADASNNIKFVRGFGWEAYNADEKFRVFPTLDEAVAYKSGTNAASIYPYENVVQNADVVLPTAQGTASRISSDRGYDITWNLNGYTVEQKTASGNPLESTVLGKFTLDDTSEAKTGKWIAGGCNTTSDPWNGGGGPAFLVKGDGELLLKGGTVSIARNTDANGNAIVNNNLVQINAGKLIVDGATLQCEDTYGIAAWGGNVVVNSGKFNIGSNNQNSILAVAYQADGYAGSCSVEVNTAIDGYMAVYSGATAKVNAAGVKYVADGTTTIAPAVGEGLVAQGGVVGYPVAKIGETGYLTLEAALAAVQDNETVTLLADVTYTKATGAVNDSYVDGLVYDGDKNFTVDFAGHTITENGEINDYLVYLKNTGEKDNEITFKNGTIAINEANENTAWAAITVGSNSSTHKTTLNLNGMKVTNGNPNDESNQVIRIRNGATANLNDGTLVTSNGTSYGVVAQTASVVNINSGARVVHTNSGTTGGNLVYTAVSGNGTINIYDGAVIESDKYAIHNMTSGNAVINIYGGTITAPVAVHAATNGGADETATVNITGGTFDGAMEEYTNTANIHVSGGTFTVDVTEFCAEGYVCKANDNGTYGVQFASYIVLPDGVNSSNYAELFGDNTVTDGTNYYATLQAAVEAVAGQANAVLYCKPGADVGSLQHAPVTSTLTVYGNGADVTGDTERDFDLGNTDPSGGKDITADMTLTVKHLSGCGAWGTKATEHTVNLVFENCANMGKVFITGTTGTLNITMTDCAFEGVIKEAVYSNADGAITLTNVAFSNLNKAVNLNHKAAGTQTVTINGCTFTNCGADVAADQIPVRVLSSVEGGKSVLSVTGSTFTGTPEGGADILLDYGVGLTTASVSGTAANVVVEKENNVGTTTAVNADETVEFTTALPVAQVGETKYMTLAEAVAAAQAGDEIVLLGDVELTESLVIAAGKEVVLDLNGKTVSMADASGKGAYAIKNNGNLTIVDNSDAKTGKITFNSTTPDNSFGYATSTIGNGGSLTVESGTIENTTVGGASYAIDGIWHTDEASLTINGGTIVANKIAVRQVPFSATANNVVTVNGGTLTGATAGLQLFNINNDAKLAEVNIHGGEFNGSYAFYTSFTSAAASEDVTINIDGGEFNGYLFLYNGKNGSDEYPMTVSVTGGTFNGGAYIYTTDANGDEVAIPSITGGTFVNDVTVYCVDGYLCEANGDGTYGVEEKVELPEVVITDIKDSLTDSDPDLTFALNFAIKDIENLTDEYLEKLFAQYGDWYTDYVLTISGLTDENVTFNANGNGDGYLAGQYDAWSENWVSVPFEDVTLANGASIYIMEYAAKLMNKQGLRFTLAEVAEIVQNFDCGVYFTPEFLAANPGLKVDLHLKVFTEDAEGNKVNDINVATNNFDVENYVAIVHADGKQTKYCTTLADAVAAATDGATVTMLSNVELTEAVKVVGKAITLDLNGKTVSGTCNSNQGHLIYIENGAGLTVKDGAANGGGKLTYAQGTSNVGWTVAVMGNLTLESGTIELTGSWNIGYAVDVRPNAWGVAYTAPSVFTMNGGNVVSSDGAVRVASSSSDTYADVSASFVMNGGKIDAAWDGVFIQQSNAAYDVLNFTINGGTIESDLNPVRVYGPAPTSYVNGQECMSINFNGGTMTYTGTETREWVIDGVLRVGGGSSIETIVENGNITAGEAFAQAQALPEGYIWEQDGETYKVVEAPKAPEVVDGKIEFVDGEFDMYTNDTDIEDVEITYKRTIDSDWNALYVPFAIPASELLADFDIAYINDVRETDEDDDGELDGWQMELIKIKKETAVLRANHPYFVRSKSADYDENNLSLTLTTTLYKATAAEFECSSVYSTYTIKGLNELRASTEFGDADRVLGYDNGETTWGKMADGYSLKPFRFYLTITNHDGSPVVSSSAQMSIVVRDEDGTTGIGGIYGDENGETVIFDLYGRRVLEPEKGNIYIINGKKVLVK